jgi:hypothetical protein
MRLKSFLLVAALSLGLAAPVHGESIVNGTFDTSVPSNGTGGGWTSGTIDGAGGWRSTGGNPGGMFIINDNGSFGTDPFIQQLVSGLVAGNTYTLTGNYKNIYNCCGSRGPNTFAIDVDGTTVATLGYPGANVWGSFSLNIFAPDTDLLIRFRAEINGDDTEYAIDNISMNPSVTSVPEPNTLLLTLSGLGFLGGVLHRRHAQRS